MVRDVSADVDFSTAVDDSTGFRTRSILCAPLMVKGRMLGALEVINKRKGDGLFDLADKQFLQVLAGMVSLAVHNAQMTEALVEQERMRRELDLAREIQRDLLPDQPAAAFPVQGLNLSAFEVSGDFYDFFTLSDGRIAWGLGDVSGKGMNAAMLMAKTISLFRCLGKTVHDPACLLAMLNDEIAETASRGMFVTMAAGVFDPLSGEIIFANAGHQPPLFRNQAGAYRELEESSPPLGILPGMEYTGQRLQLDGGRLYLFTDGVTEGWAEGGSMLELFGLKALLDKHSLLPPADQLARVAEALVRPGARLHDDLTLLVIG
jgi:sigma-B regulation protein RsbU (phosphoserine phosphatase)